MRLVGCGLLCGGILLRPLAIDLEVVLMVGWKGENVIGNRTDVAEADEEDRDRLLRL